MENSPNTIISDDVSSKTVGYTYVYKGKEIQAIKCTIETRETDGKFIGKGNCLYTTDLSGYSLVGNDGELIGILMNTNKKQRKFNLPRLVYFQIRKAMNELLSKNKTSIIHPALIYNEL